MPLPPRSNHRITLAEARVLTSEYRRHAGIGATKGGLFWKEAVEGVLSQEGCVALRYYYAKNEAGKPALVLLGVDKTGRDLVRGVIIEISWPCPPYCDWPNLLNSDGDIQKPMGTPSSITTMIATTNL